ncbi:MAG: hydroxypyruvate isomerase [Sphaerobacteraceae bacterium]|nr:MAG: hydroxypyruvate isomerase [Sphaerobacteraceae bacterium]
MPRFAANLTMLFNDSPFPERIDRAARAGFSGIEFLFPYSEDVDAIRDALRRNNITQVLFNLPAGDFAGGERGIANDPTRTEEFREGVKQALDIADTLDCSMLNCLSGLAVDGVDHDTQWKTLVENFRYAAEQAESAGVLQLVEPINTFDMPGFMVSSTSEGLKLINDVGHSNLKLQYDVYHMQRMEGELIGTMKANLEMIEHIQIADNPGRHQPGTGEINYPFVLSQIDQMGYKGWVSLEYVPDGKTEATLGWLRDWGYWS